MNNFFKNKKWHLKSRILFMLLLLLTIVFFSVFIAFNLYTERYIKSNVKEQLDYLTEDFQQHPVSIHVIGGNPVSTIESGVLVTNPTINTETPAPSISISNQRKNRIGVMAEVLILNEEYVVQNFNPEEVVREETEQIAKELKEKNIDLANANYVYIETETDEYYISTTEDLNYKGNYIVFYVSVAGINNLVDVINEALLVIMAFGMIICFVLANLIANSITKPLKNLSDFALEIGKGNFERQQFSFYDIEFDDFNNSMNLSAERLDLYDKDQKVFFQNVSHEFRTPLQSIRSYAEGIQFELMDSKKACSTIIDETDRLSELVEDLLYVSRMDSFTQKTEKTWNDLRETLSICAENQKILAEKIGIEFIYDFDNKAVNALYNEKQMYRAFSNLISNALRYAKSNVTLRCININGGVEISVIDDGLGISEQDLPNIFKRFYKGEKGKNGIGLSIVKSVVELHEGEILVDLESGTGFRIILKNIGEV